MISQDNLNTLLDQLGFTGSRQHYSKTIGEATLAVDWKKGQISYPEAQGLIVNERQTCNLQANENFVVFECVHRLLEKGYRPANIELEPKWKVGHGASGGRADILVKDNAGKPLLIIECKTAGGEFNRAWKKTLQDGDQLFSYAQQISETRFLCLYTVDLEDGTPVYTSHVIAHRDNEKYLEDNPDLKRFANASDVKARFAVWRDTYKLGYATKGIFEANIPPWQIGKDRYTLDDLNLVAASDQQKKYHEFATILRQHNVSGRENAFDKLVNLLLCKLVDETLNPQDLKFYWKGVAYDSHFDLFDRLQQLYKDGMGKFLGEPITYIDRAAVHNAMRFIRQNPDATQRAVWQLFLQQKFFTNNDFSFIDVHNEKLFYQNADVLLKIIQMWQDIRLTNEDGDSQFLGDLFEGFLDQGIKQSEGQYFTPLPICRFILMSLPLQTLVAQQTNPPKIIDYACGAGHFLTECARQLRDFVPPQQRADVHKAMIGIEKEYRLSKVAKVSAFMHGQRDIAICYGDALVKTHPSHPQIVDGTFDLLVANPPYSVKGFLETLPEAERAAYDLSRSIDKLDTNNSIETFFIERARQLLKAGGIAAIILPASILSNGGSVYIKTREILIQSFDLVAIAEFGSGTFGKTGTNTVTLFLRRKATAPDTAEHYRERVAEWFAGTFPADPNQPVYRDEHLIDRYAAHIGIPAADYKTLLQGDAHGPWCKADYFDACTAAFNDSADIKALYKQRRFNALPEAEQNAEIDRRYLAFVHTIERDKLLHFVLASEQPNPVLIVKSPSETKAQKQFLGYDWSAAKGDEGIKLVKDAAGRHQTVLYDESDRAHPEKINALIAANFDGQPEKLPESLKPYVSRARLVDLLDFSRVTFEKQISLTPKASVYVQSSRYPMERLLNLASMLRRGKASKYGRTNIQIIKSGQARGNFEFDFSEPHFVDANFIPDERILQAGDLLINSTGKGTAGRVTYFDLPGKFVVDSHISILRSNEKILPKFGLYSLARIGFKNLESLAQGSSGQIELSLDTIGQIEIPLPPLNIQHQIVAECQLVDDEVAAAQSAIAAARAAVDGKIGQIYASAAVMQPVDALALAVQYGLSEKMNEAGVGYRIFRMNEIVAGRMLDNGRMKCADISADEFAKYRLNKGDLLFNRTNGSLDHVGKTGLFDLDGDYCFASYLVRVVPDTAKVAPLFLCLMMNSPAFRQEAIGKAVKSAGQNNINATKMRHIKVPVPPLAEQQRIVAEVDAERRAIAAAEALIAAAPARKQAILGKYL